MTNTWLNSDGLYVKYGPDEGTAGKGGVFKDWGLFRSASWKLTLADYPFGSTVYIIDDNCFMPKARYDAVRLTVHTAVTGASATLDFGLQATDRSTEIDINGFLAAVPTTDMDGEAGISRTYYSEATDSIPLPAAGGALLGTTTTSVGYPCVRVNTASFTAGVITLELFWRPV